jgi:hypothetical protein
MVAMAGRLASAGFVTMTFNYLYTEEGRRAPDRLPKLLDVHAGVAERFSKDLDTVILAGKSMGGRVGGHVVSDGRFGAGGLVYFGYPLVAMGKQEPRDTSHLTTIALPQIFVSGTRDPMGPIDLIASVAASQQDATMLAIDGGDHSLVPLKRSGRTVDDTLDEAVAGVTDWWNVQR